MLSDAIKKDSKGASDDDAPALAISLHAAPPDPVVAMGRLRKALHAGDDEAAYDAFCLLQAAHEDRMEKSGKDDDESPDSGY